MREIAPRNLKALELLAHLTLREQEILSKLVRSQLNKIVAHEFGISPRTVEIHRARIPDKLAARNLSDIARILLYAA